MIHAVWYFFCKHCVVTRVQADTINSILYYILVLDNTSAYSHRASYMATYMYQLPRAEDRIVMGTLFAL